MLTYLVNKYLLKTNCILKYMHKIMDLYVCKWNLEEKKFGEKNSAYECTCNIVNIFLFK
jgi:hypothetical protein